MSKETFKIHKREQPFTMVENALINNQTLSWSAKGVLIYLLSKPDGWKVYKADIVNHATNGISSVKSIIKELKCAGYITLSKILDQKGRIIEWRYDIYEEPLNKPIEALKYRKYDRIPI